MKLIFAFFILLRFLNSSLFPADFLFGSVVSVNKFSFTVFAEESLFVAVCKKHAETRSVIWHNLIYFF